MSPNTLNFTPKCNEEYYKEDDEITECCGLSVYQSTYREYLQTKKRLKEELLKALIASIWMLVSALPFYYALVDAIVSLSRDETISIRRSLTSALRAFPALLASEILTLLVVVVVLFLIAVPLITVGPLAGIIEGIIESPP